jgi:hypothetical protein
VRIIVAGSRVITSQALVEKAIRESGFSISVLLSGHARGVDQLAEEWAKSNKICVELYPANWDLYGKMAGPIRNGEMIEKAEGLVALWDGVSAGTRDVIKQATKNARRVFVFRTDKD